MLVLRKDVLHPFGNLKKALVLEKIVPKVNKVDRKIGAILSIIAHNRDPKVSHLIPVTPFCSVTLFHFVCWSDGGQRSRRAL